MSEVAGNAMSPYHMKLAFLALGALACVMVLVMNSRVGNSGGDLIKGVLFDKEDDLLPHDSLHKILKEQERKRIEKDGLKNTRHSHNHDDEVRFVLHESHLGGPEFIGKNSAVGKEAGLSHQDAAKDSSHIFSHIKERKDQYDVQLGNKAPSMMVALKGENTIAVGCAITTRNQLKLTEDNMLLEMPFFKSLVNSFCLTATVGFDYHFYVGHDHYDPFFMKGNQSHEIFERLFYGFTERTCPARLNVTLHLVECNHSGNPAWAQNDAMMAAYMDNIAYYYRVNDDTIMETTGWSEKFVEELERFTPPKIGVVGPWFKEGNVVILTHDFVHRTHVDIFGFYYPRVFTDWFADDWITGVYWPERCRKVPGTRVKHTMEQGQRYVAHYEKANKVKIEVEIGKLILKRYLERLENRDLTGTWNSDSKNLISMSLYGGNIDMLYGALRYSQLVPIIFPQWRLRVYAQKYEEDPQLPKVLKIILKKLENSGIEVIKLGLNVTEVLPPDMWSLLIADDMQVERFIVRDPNTRPSDRERASLNSWLLTDKILHCVRDYPTHSSTALVPSLVGGIPNKLQPLIGQPVAKVMIGYSSAFQFLQSFLWPKVKNVCFCHDSVSCTQWPGAQPFPVLRKENEFIGQRFDANDQIYNEDNKDIMLWDKKYILPECVFVKNTGFLEDAVRSVIRHRPVFWSQDYHVTPVMDMKSLLTPIGVKILDNSLSYYCGNVGTCAEGLKVINRENGMRLTPELIEQFYQVYRNDPLMKTVTAFVCTLPVAMCELFTNFNKSMIIIATIRYEQARPEPEKWHALNQLLLGVSKDPHSVVAANNLYDAKYIEYFTGIKPVIIPHFCGYLRDFYRPSRKQFLLAPIHSTELYDSFFSEFDEIIMRKQLDLVIFPLREMYPQYLFGDLAAHPGIIYVPYQVSMSSLTEQYRMNIPLFFPTLELLSKWHVQYQVVRQRTWACYMRKKSMSSDMPGVIPNVPDPNNDLDQDAVKYWLRFSDFYQWPHIIYFESMSDLVDKMLNVDLAEISRRMKTHNDEVRVKVKQVWSQVLLKVTEGRKIY